MAWELLVHIEFGRTSTLNYKDTSRNNFDRYMSLAYQIHIWNCMSYYM